MITAAFFVLAAAVGTLARAEAARRWNPELGLAIGTMAVNVSGSFLLGLLSGLTPPAVTVVGVGGLGAYTTFSGFARDAVALFEQRRYVLSVLYIGGSCGLGIGAAALGVVLAGA